MEFRSQIAFAVATAVATAALASAESFTYEIRGGGTLKVDEEGIAFSKPKKRLQVWTYTHLQEVKVSDNQLLLVTYEDSPRWKLGVDRSFRFQLADPQKDFRAVHELLQDRLDQRLVSALADPPTDFQWKVLVKKLGLVKGSEGTLYVAADRLIYHSAIPGQSRTWRLQDLENVHSSGPFDLTLTTYERARAGYGSQRSFHFRLKEALDQARVDTLWRRLAKLP
jgi:hypothetical protein